MKKRKLQTTPISGTQTITKFFRVHPDESRKPRSSRASSLNDKQQNSNKHPGSPMSRSDRSSKTPSPTPQTPGLNGSPYPTIVDAFRKTNTKRESERKKSDRDEVTVIHVDVTGRGGSRYYTRDSTGRGVRGSTMQGRRSWRGGNVGRGFGQPYNNYSPSHREYQQFSPRGRGFHNFSPSRGSNHQPFGQQGNFMGSRGRGAFQPRPLLSCGQYNNRMGRGGNRGWFGGSMDNRGHHNNRGNHSNYHDINHGNMNNYQPGQQCQNFSGNQGNPSQCSCQHGQRDHNFQSSRGRPFMQYSGEGSSPSFKPKALLPTPVGNFDGYGNGHEEQMGSPTGWLSSRCDHYNQEQEATGDRHTSVHVSPGKDRFGEQYSTCNPASQTPPAGHQMSYQSPKRSGPRQSRWDSSPAEKRTVCFGEDENLIFSESRDREKPEKLTISIKNPTSPPIASSQTPGSNLVSVREYPSHWHDSPPFGNTPRTQNLGEIIHTHDFACSSGNQFHDRFLGSVSRNGPRFNEFNGKPQRVFHSDTTQKDTAFTCSSPWGSPKEIPYERNNLKDFHKKDRPRDFAIEGTGRPIYDCSPSKRKDAKLTDTRPKKDYKDDSRGFDKGSHVKENIRKREGLESRVLSDSGDGSRRRHSSRGESSSSMRDNRANKHRPEMGDHSKSTHKRAPSSTSTSESRDTWDSEPIRPTGGKLNSDHSHHYEPGQRTPSQKVDGVSKHSKYRASSGEKNKGSPGRSRCSHVSEHSRNQHAGLGTSSTMTRKDGVNNSKIREHHKHSDTDSSSVNKCPIIGRKEKVDVDGCFRKSQKAGSKSSDSRSRSSRGDCLIDSNKNRSKKNAFGYQSSAGNSSSPRTSRKSQGGNRSDSEGRNMVQSVSGKSLSINSSPTCSMIGGPVNRKGLLITREKKEQFRKKVAESSQGKFMKRICSTPAQLGCITAEDKTKKVERIKRPSTASPEVVTSIRLHKITDSPAKVDSVSNSTQKNAFDILEDLRKSVTMTSWTALTTKNILPSTDKSSEEDNVPLSGVKEGLQNVSRLTEPPKKSMASYLCRYSRVSHFQEPRRKKTKAAKVGRKSKRCFAGPLARRPLSPTASQLTDWDDDVSVWPNHVRVLEAPASPTPTEAGPMPNMATSGRTTETKKSCSFVQPVSGMSSCSKADARKYGGLQGENEAECTVSDSANSSFCFKVPESDYNVNIMNPASMDSGVAMSLAESDFNIATSTLTARVNCDAADEHDMAVMPSSSDSCNMAVIGADPTGLEPMHLEERQSDFKTSANVGDTFSDVPSNAMETECHGNISNGFRNSASNIRFGITRQSDYNESILRGSISDFTRSETVSFVGNARARYPVAMLEKQESRCFNKDLTSNISSSTHRSSSHLAENINTPSSHLALDPQGNSPLDQPVKDFTSTEHSFSLSGYENNNMNANPSHIPDDFLLYRDGEFRISDCNSTDKSLNIFSLSLMEIEFYESVLNQTKTFHSGQSTAKIKELNGNYCGKDRTGPEKLKNVSTCNCASNCTDTNNALASCENKVLSSNCVDKCGGTFENEHHAGTSISKTSVSSCQWNLNNPVSGTRKGVPSVEPPFSLSPVDFDNLVVDTMGIHPGFSMDPVDFAIPTESGTIAENNGDHCDVEPKQKQIYESEVVSKRVTAVMSVGTGLKSETDDEDTLQAESLGDAAKEKTTEISDSDIDSDAPDEQPNCEITETLKDTDHCDTDICKSGQDMVKEESSDSAWGSSPAKQHTGTNDSDSLPKEVVKCGDAPPSEAVPSNAFDCNSSAEEAGCHDEKAYCPMGNRLAKVCSQNVKQMSVSQSGKHLPCSPREVEAKYLPLVEHVMHTKTSLYGETDAPGECFHGSAGSGGGQQKLINVRKPHHDDKRCLAGCANRCMDGGSKNVKQASGKKMDASDDSRKNVTTISQNRNTVTARNGDTVEGHFKGKCLESQSLPEGGTHTGSWPGELSTVFFPNITGEKNIEQTEKVSTSTSKNSVTTCYGHAVQSVINMRDSVPTCKCSVHDAHPITITRDLVPKSKCATHHAQPITPTRDSVPTGKCAVHDTQSVMITRDLVLNGKCAIHGAQSTSITRDSVPSDKCATHGALSVSITEDLVPNGKCGARSICITRDSVPNGKCATHDAQSKTIIRDSVPMLNNSDLSEDLVFGKSDAPPGLVSGPIFEDDSKNVSEADCMKNSFKCQCGTGCSELETCVKQDRFPVSSVNGGDSHLCSKEACEKHGTDCLDLKNSEKLGGCQSTYTGKRSEDLDEGNQQGGITLELGPRCTAAKEKIADSATSVKTVSVNTPAYGSFRQDETPSENDIAQGQTADVAPQSPDLQPAPDSSDDNADLGDSDSDNDLLDTPVALKCLSLQQASTKSPPGTPEHCNSFETSKSPYKEVCGTISQSTTLPDNSKSCKFSLDQLLAEKQDKEEKNRELESMTLALKEGIRNGGVSRLHYERCQVLFDEDLLPQHRQKLEQLKVSEHVIQDTHPGETVFKSGHYRQLFSYPGTLTLSSCGFVAGTSMLDRHLSSLAPELVLELLQGETVTLCFESLCSPEAFLSWSFQLMSIQDNQLVSRAAYKILYEAMNKEHGKAVKWVPSLRDIVRVFVNYGATLGELCPPDMVPFTDIDLREESKENENEEQEMNVNSSDTWAVDNLQLVIQTISFAVTLRPRSYTVDELELLVLLLCRVALESRICDVKCHFMEGDLAEIQRLLIAMSVRGKMSHLGTEQVEHKEGAINQAGNCLKHDFQVALSAVLNAIPKEKWHKKVINLCRTLPKITDHHHNKAYLVQLMPPIERGLYVQRRLSYSMLLQLLFEDRELEDSAEVKVEHLFSVMKRIKVTADLDYYQLSSIMSLIDLCVGNEILPRAERNDLRLLIDKLRGIMGDVRDNIQMMDRTRVKDMMVRMTSKWTFIIQSMGATQKSMYDWMHVNSQTTATDNSQSNQDTVDSDLDDCESNSHQETRQSDEGCQNGQTDQPYNGSGQPDNVHNKSQGEVGMEVDSPIINDDDDNNDDGDGEDKDDDDELPEL